MYRPRDDDLEMRCWICSRSTILTRPATKADARDSQHQQRVDRELDRWLDRMGIGRNVVRASATPPINASSPLTRPRKYSS